MQSGKSIVHGSETYCCTTIELAHRVLGYRNIVKRYRTLVFSGSITPSTISCAVVCTSPKMTPAMMVAAVMVMMTTDMSGGIGISSCHVGTRVDWHIPSRVHWHIPALFAALFPVRPSLTPFFLLVVAASIAAIGAVHAACAGSL